MITDELIGELAELAHAQPSHIRAWIAMHVEDDIIKRKAARGRKRGLVRGVAVQLATNPRIKMIVSRDAIEEVEIERM